jgi:hypothetical protein
MDNLHMDNLHMDNLQNSEEREKPTYKRLNNKKIISISFLCILVFLLYLSLVIPESLDNYSELSQITDFTELKLSGANQQISNNSLNSDARIRKIKSILPDKPFLYGNNANLLINDSLTEDYTIINTVFKYEHYMTVLERRKNEPRDFSYFILFVDDKLVEISNSNILNIEVIDETHYAYSKDNTEYWIWDKESDIRLLVASPNSAYDRYIGEISLNGMKYDYQSLKILRKLKKYERFNDGNDKYLNEKFGNIKLENVRSYNYRIGDGDVRYYKPNYIYKLNLKFDSSGNYKFIDFKPTSCETEYHGINWIFPPFFERKIYDFCEEVRSYVIEGPNIKKYKNKIFNGLINNLSISSDGKNTVFIWQNKLILNGEYYFNEKYDEISSIEFSKDSKYLSFKGKRNDNFYLVNMNLDDIFKK